MNFNKEETEFSEEFVKEETTEVQEETTEVQEEETVNLSHYFRETFVTNAWGSDESVSGPGSEITSPLVQNCIICIVNFINEFLHDKENIIISDIPCGDFNWINILLKEILEKTNCKTIEYYAYDIVEKIEEKFNTLEKIDHVTYSFQVFNAVTDVSVKADIILCKEMFIHLSYLHINNCLENFKKSGSTFLLCSDSHNIENKNIEYSSFGECRHVSLMLPPFNLPEPLYHYTFYKLWELEKINDI